MIRTVVTSAGVSVSLLAVMMSVHAKGTPGETIYRLDEVARARSELRPRSGVKFEALAVQQGSLDTRINTDGIGDTRTIVPPLASDCGDIRM